MNEDIKQYENISDSEVLAAAQNLMDEFDEAFKVRLIAVSADENAKLVYTLDGSDPTANSTKVDASTS
jgi:alpha-amylase